MPEWVKVCHTGDVPVDGGACVSWQGAQIAIFHVAARGAWLAVQNRCPHWNEQVLSRGMTGEQDGRLKVACPMHKRTYALADGTCLSGDADDLVAFQVEVRGDEVWIEKPSDEFVARERQLAGLDRRSA